jgi:hypothetical protein
MLRLSAAFAAAALLTSPALAAGPCKDAKGKFVKCPTAAAAPAVNKLKNGRCQFAAGPKKGQFTKCA